MTYEVTHFHNKRKEPMQVKVKVHEIGDRVMIKNPVYTEGSLIHNPVIPFTFKRSRKHTNRSKY